MAMNSSWPEDRARLVVFVKEWHVFMREIVEAKVDPKGILLFPAELHPLIDEAWKEFDFSFSLSKAEEKIFEADDERIEWAGLRGAQLALKLFIVERLKGLFRRIGGKKLLARLFQAIDNVFDSLIAATGLDQALKEIKDCLTSCLDE